MIMYYNIKMQ